jgi:hypothetical protein
MKHLVLISFFLFSLHTFAQFSDDFFDTNLSDRWSGNVENFTVNGDGQLQLNTTGAGTSALTIPTSFIDNLEWEFRVKLDFSPSNQNYTRIYLFSDNADLTSPLNGYYIQLGATGSEDPIELFRQSGNTRTSLLKGNPRLVATAFDIRIKVTRSEAGEWTIFTDPTGGTDFQQEATVVDDTFPSGNYFGLLCTYTTTNSAKFYFDDIRVTGDIYIDTTTPEITEVSANANQVNVQFSEAINDITAANFSIANIGNPTEAILSADKTTVTLTFANDFPTNADYTLTVHNISDLAGNILQEAAETFTVYEIPELPAAGDIIMNEIMFNAAEGSVDYIEIYNKSDKTLDLSGVQFIRQTATTAPTEIIPEGTIILPNSYLAFTADPELIREQFVVPVEANIAELELGSFLSNSEATIKLTNAAEDILFDELTYSENWHSPLISEAQGVALERINPALPTQDASNWHSAASTTHWGTPGYANLHLSDNQPSVTGKKVWAEPENFTPDNDGYNDFTTIYFDTENIGYFATVTIYDALGREVRSLANNLLISPEAFKIWDGTDDDGQMVNVGIYAVYAEIIRPEDGKREQFKFPCVVSAVKR